MNSIARGAMVVILASLFVMLLTPRSERTVSGQGGLFKLMAVNGAEIRRASPGGGPASWHVGPQRQYVITLKGHGELEIADGKTIPVGPGDIELIEDTTGKGHITRVTGDDDRIILLLQLADQSGK